MRMLGLPGNGSPGTRVAAPTPGGIPPGGRKRGPESSPAGELPTGAGEGGSATLRSEPREPAPRTPRSCARESRPATPQEERHAWRTRVAVEVRFGIEPSCSRASNAGRSAARAARSCSSRRRIASPVSKRCSRTSLRRPESRSVRSISRGREARDRDGGGLDRTRVLGVAAVAAAPIRPAPGRPEVPGSGLTTGRRARAVGARPRVGVSRRRAVARSSSPPGTGSAARSRARARPRRARLRATPR
jgi:hypothetical protein